jgi:hypothetical protein
MPNAGAHHMMSNHGRMQSLAEQKLHLQMLSQPLATSHLSREEQRNLHISMESHRYALTDSVDANIDPALVK